MAGEISQDQSRTVTIAPAGLDGVLGLPAAPGRPRPSGWSPSPWLTSRNAPTASAATPGRFKGGVITPPARRFSATTSRQDHRSWGVIEDYEIGPL